MDPRETRLNDTVGQGLRQAAMQRRKPDPTKGGTRPK